MQAFQGGGSGGRPFGQAGMIVAIQLIGPHGRVTTHMITPVPFRHGERLAIGCIGEDAAMTAYEKASIDNGYAPASVLEDHVRFIVLEE